MMYHQANISASIGQQALPTLTAVTHLAEIAADLFVIGQLTYCCSNFFEVAEIHRKSEQAVICQLKLKFTRIPEVLNTDDAPEFGNQEIKSLSSDWHLEH